MADKVIKTRLIMRYKTEAEWKTSNEILKKGEMGVSTDKNGMFKLGDGTSTWTALSYNRALTADHLTSAVSIKIENTAKNFDGSAALTWTLADIGAAAASHGTHVTYATVEPKAAGTAAVGTSAKVAREDHVHPAQTSVTGNAGTATKLQTARTINGVSFNGTANITITANPTTNALKDQDLDSVLTPGFYHGGGSNTVKSKPDGIDAFGMIVYKSADGYTTQELTGGNNSPSKKFIRQYNGSAWSDWEFYYTTAYVPPAAGSSGTADKLKTARDIKIGNTAIKKFDGSANISYTLAEIGAAAASHTHTKSQITDFPTSLKNPTSVIIKLNGGTTEGTNLFTYDGSTAKTVNITAASVGAATSGHNHDTVYAKTSHTHTIANVTDLQKELDAKQPKGSYAAADHNHDSVYAKTSHGTHVSFSTAVPLVAGTAAVGTASTVSRSDHVHPAQTSVSGNAGTATKLQTARGLKIGNTSKNFDGSAAVTWTLAEIGAAAASHTHTKSQITDFPASLKNPTSIAIKLNGGTTEGTNLFTYDGSTAKSLNITASSIGAAASSHTHSIANVTNLQSELDNKQPKGNYAASSHKHNPTDINGGYTNTPIYIDTHPENGKAILPFINNDIAFLLKRGGTMTMTRNGVAVSADFSPMFDGSPSYFSFPGRPFTDDDVYEIEIGLPKTFTWSSIIGISFGAVGWRAKDIEFLVMNPANNETEWTSKAHVTDWALGEYMSTISHNSGTGFNKLKIILKHPPVGDNFRIASIFIVSYSSLGLRETFLPKDGGELYGNLNPFKDNSYDLGSSSKKWRSIYVNNIYGKVTGNTDTATKLATARTLTIGSTGKAFDGSANVSWSLSEIGAAAASHGTHVTWETEAPKANGTAAVGTSSKVARGDHVHPLQTTVSGNAGSATKLATARKIGNASFDGTADITLSQIGAAASSHTHTKSQITDFPSSLKNPSSVIIKLNGGTTEGTNLFTYDGSAAKTVNITASSIGAATSGHNHDSTYAKTSHTHTIANVTGLQDELDGKQPKGSYAAASHGTHVSFTTTLPVVAGTAAVGTASTVSRSDHVHPAQTSVSGNAGTATKLATARGLKIGNTSKNFDGSAAVTWTLAEIGAAASSHTHTKSQISDFPASLKNPSAITVKLNGGTTEGTNLFTYDGSAAKAIDITPAAIGAAASSHGTHVTYATTAPKAAGTAAVGTVNRVAREDHIHPLQTSVSGNAGTATKLATARKISIGKTTKTFDGSADISFTTSELSDLVGSHTHSEYLPITGGVVSGYIYFGDRTVGDNYIGPENSNHDLYIKSSNILRLNAGGTGGISLNGKYISISDNSGATVKIQDDTVIIEQERSDIRIADATASAPGPILITGHDICFSPEASNRGIVFANNVKMDETNMIVAAGKGKAVDDSKIPKTLS